MLDSTAGQHGVRDHLFQPVIARRSRGRLQSGDGFFPERASTHSLMAVCADVSFVRRLVCYVPAICDCVTDIPKSCGRPTGGLVIVYECGPFAVEVAALTSHEVLLAFMSSSLKIVRASLSYRSTSGTRAAYMQILACRDNRMF